MSDKKYGKPARPFELWNIGNYETIYWKEKQKEDFVLKVIPKEDPIHVIPEDVLFLTNVQQLEERKSKKKEVEEYIDRVYELPVLFFQCPENKEA